jgi:glutamate transport system ATP-binding protein
MQYFLTRYATRPTDSTIALPLTGFGRYAKGRRMCRRRVDSRNTTPLYWRTMSETTATISAPTAQKSSQTGQARSPLVELSHVEKHFGKLHVLKDINISVDKGEVLVVVGPSGSGKSTMCRTINRLEGIDSGVIRIDGHELPQEGRDLATLRAEVGMVFQSFNLFANKTILDNVTLAPVKVRHMNRKEAEDLAMDMLARVGVESQAEKMPSPAFRRSAAACRHRPRAGDETQGDAFR